MGDGPETQQHTPEQREQPREAPKPPEGQRPEREARQPTPAEIHQSLVSLEQSAQQRVALEQATAQLPEGQKRPAREALAQGVEEGGLAGLAAAIERLGKFIENISTVVDQFLKKLGLGKKDEGTPATDSERAKEPVRGAAEGAEGSKAGVLQTKNYQLQTGESREGTAGIEGLTPNEPLLGREKRITVNGQEMTCQLRTDELIANGHRYRMKYNGMRATLKNPTEWRDNGLTITGTVDLGLFSPEETVTIPTNKAVSFLQQAAQGRTFVTEGITFEKVS